MMISTLPLAISQLFDPAIIRVFVKTFLLTLVLFLMGGVGFWYGSMWLADHFGYGAYSDIIAAGAVLISVIGAWVLFRAVAIMVLGVFADDVVEAVERRHYPAALETGRNPSFVLSLRMGLAAATRTVLINLFALPFYIALIVTGIGTLILFVAINAVLLGRDLGEMVAVRHMPVSEIAVWRRMTRGRLWVLGLIVTGLFMIPFVNLVAPIIGAALATHMFHGRK